MRNLTGIVIVILILLLLQAAWPLIVLLLVIYGIKWLVSQSRHKKIEDPYHQQKQMHEDWVHSSQQQSSKQTNESVIDAEFTERDVDQH